MLKKLAKLKQSRPPFVWSKTHRAKMSRGLSGRSQAHSWCRKEARWCCPDQTSSSKSSVVQVLEYPEVAAKEGWLMG